jgi:hypothetical protein
MELDVTQRFRFRNRIEEEKWRKNTECYNCGKTGHYAVQCPTKKPNQYRKTYRAAEATYEEEPLEDQSGKEELQE